MFAIRGPSYIPNSTGKPDGMWVKKDGYFTDSSASAVLFDTVDEAKAFISEKSTANSYTYKELFVVEVETKVVIQRATKNFSKIV